jgi:putative ABC transport system permease protein
MFRYYLKLALLSIRGNPVLSALMVAAIGVGIGACMTIVNIHYVMGRNPIPHRSDVLYHVQVDSWDPNEPYYESNDPPDQLTYLDGTALWTAGKARRQVLSYATAPIVEPADPEQPPFQVIARTTTADFFPMFDVPLRYGRGWDRSADEGRERVVVLGQETNERLFGGENSVGRSIVLNGESFRVVGVLEDWQPVPRFYDVSGGAFDEVEDIFYPFSVGIARELGNVINTNCWKPVEEDGWQAFLSSECVWMQMWVELHGEDEVREYQAFLDAYVQSQKALGRFQRPLNNRLLDVMEWMENQQVVADDVQVLLGLAGLFLVVCLLNTIGLLLAKILRRSGDIGLRRALGATRGAIFSQYIVEAGLIGLSGGVLGVALTWLGLRGIEALYAKLEFIGHLVRMDWMMIVAAIVLAVLSALGAALYPTWRACSIHPASQLKAL